MISIVVAAAKNRVIGKDNRIPWRLRTDLKHLRDLTADRTVILGRNTYDSMVWYYDKSGKEMPGKTYIVVSRTLDYTPARKNAQVAHSIEDALAQAHELGDDSFAIGGNAIYQALLPFTDTIYLTEVQAGIEGDTYFPKLAEKEWQEVAREHHLKDERNEYDYDFVTLQRIRT